jgi:prepilin-type N-terminal cleavage/methylation domain-containing protein
MRTAKTTLIGPSLIEVLVCLAILGLLVGIVLH